MPAQAPQVATQGIAVDLSTPEATVKSFFAAFSSSDLKRLVACVEGAKFSPDAEALEKLMKTSSEHVSIVPTAFHLETKDDVAKGTLELTAQMIPGPTSATLKDHSQYDPHPGPQDSITLHKAGGHWLVVPGKVPEFDDLMASVVDLGNVTAAHPEILVKARNAAYAARCATQMKFLSAALMEFTLDHQDRFALKTESLHAGLLPYLIKEEKAYLKSPRSIYENTENNAKLLAERSFHCPNADPGEISCRFNKNLEGKNSLSIPEGQSERIIAIYEGDDQKLSFRHNGKAVVGLASGRVKSVDPDEAKKLLWKP